MEASFCATAARLLPDNWSYDDERTSHFIIRPLTSLFGTLCPERLCAERPASVSHKWRTTTKTPAVSVIISFLDAEKFIEESIQTVFRQIFQDWELLLVDDGSTDRSTEIARRPFGASSSTDQVFEHQNHRNQGCPHHEMSEQNNARAKYLAILDSDDVWYPNKLQEQIR